MPTLESSGVRLHVQELGHGDKTVVLVHQLLGNMASWYFSLAPALAHTRRVVLYDMRGHGKSERPSTGYGLNSMTQDLATVIASVTDGPVSLAGHSYGAAISLRYAIDNPERVEKLALVETPLPMNIQEVTQWVMGHESVESMLAHLPEPQQRLVETRRSGNRASRLLEGTVNLVAGTALREEINAEPDISDEELESIKAQMLFCYGTSSPLASSAKLRMERVFPQARHSMLEGGHNLPMDAAPALTALLTEFLND